MFLFLLFLLLLHPLFSPSYSPPLIVLSLMMVSFLRSSTTLFTLLPHCFQPLSSPSPPCLPSLPVNPPPPSCPRSFIPSSLFPPPLLPSSLLLLVSLLLFFFSSSASSTSSNFSNSIVFITHGSCSSGGRSDVGESSLCKPDGRLSSLCYKNSAVADRGEEVGCRLRYLPSTHSSQQELLRPRPGTCCSGNT